MQKSGGTRKAFEAVSGYVNPLSELSALVLSGIISASAVGESLLRVNVCVPSAFSQFIEVTKGP